MHIFFTCGKHAIVYYFQLISRDELEIGARAKWNRAPGIRSSVRPSFPQLLPAVSDQLFPMPSLPVPVSELCLKFTLCSGQSFRWKKRQTAGQSEEWVGVIGRDVVSLSQDEAAGLLHYEFLTRSSSSRTANSDGSKKMKLREEQVLSDYFQLETSLADLYSEWRKRDVLFDSVAVKFPGVRVLRQDPVENLFSFICSSCNNIKRISAMIDKMCSKYGSLLMRDDEFGDMHSFPSVPSLAHAEVDRGLRELGFGYRAAFIQRTAEKICKENISLHAMRSLSHTEAKKELMQLPGIGRKVADCICLFSLDQPASIPVDTHVYQIAARNYMKHLPLSKKTSITEKTYNEVSSKLQTVFGSHAGWAHSVLFTADLAMFKETQT